MRLRWVVVPLVVFLGAGLALSDDYRSSFALIFIAGLSSIALTAIALERLLSRTLPEIRSAQVFRAEADRLHAFTHETTQLDLHREPGPQLARLIQSIFGLEAVGILDVDLHRAYEAGKGLIDLENLLWNAYLFESAIDDPITGITRRVLRIGNLSIGALLLRGTITPEVSSAVASLIAITFDRYHSHVNLNRTESARQVEELRTTVLDSLAHAYKTPLTAIQAASTGLIEMGSLTSAQSELVALIGAQSGVLNDLSTRLLKTARLEADEVTLRP